MRATLEHPRPLTHDEKKAAEAAFRGAPFDPSWSEAAWKVYEGITLAVARRRTQQKAGLVLERN
ncbi:MAG: hypothetical protein D6704_02960 [Nitrospirae bacterium]|nr:MAG: hypothetical protein D6704_02960 [Nitrospirota bacterium]